jgi:hypothetical protein
MRLYFPVYLRLYASGGVAMRDGITVALILGVRSRTLRVLDNNGARIGEEQVDSKKEIQAM